MWQNAEVVGEKLFLIDVKLFLPSNNRLGVLDAPPSSMRSGGAIDGLANGGEWTLLLGGLRAVNSDGRRLTFALDTWPGREPSSWSELGPGKMMNS